MSEQPKKPEPPPQSRLVQICVLIGVAVGVGSMQFIGPTYFPPPEGGGFNFQRMLAAGVVGAVCAVIGGLIGKSIELLMKK
jgi:hypothetical protein